MSNMTAIKSINEFGAKFETIYYSDCASEQDYEKRYLAYTLLSQEFNKYQIEQSSEEKNFFTDFLYWICKKYSVLRNSYRWLDKDMIYMGEHKKLTELSSECCISSCCKSSCCIPDKKILNNVIESKEILENKMQIQLLEVKSDKVSEFVDLEKGSDK